jgi:hypothetical protein
MNITCSGAGASATSMRKEASAFAMQRDRFVCARTTLVRWVPCVIGTRAKHAGPGNRRSRPRPDAKLQQGGRKMHPARSFAASRTRFGEGHARADFLPAGLPKSLINSTETGPGEGRARAHPRVNRGIPADSLIFAGFWCRIRRTGNYLRVARGTALRILRSD